MGRNDDRKRRGLLEGKEEGESYWIGTLGGKHSIKKDTQRYIYIYIYIGMLIDK